MSHQLRTHRPYLEPRAHGLMLRYFSGVISPRTNRLTWILWAPSAALAAVIAGTVMLSRVAVDWTPWRPATCLPGACFCEFVRAGTVRQTANTWSSFAFVWVGFWILGVTIADRNDVRRGANDAARGADNGAILLRPVHAIVFAVALMLVGVGSAFYHASLTFAGQFADVFGMYLIGSFMLIYNVARLRPLSDASAMLLYLSLNVLLALLLYFVPETRRYLFALLIVVALVIDVAVRRQRSFVAHTRYLTSSVSMLAVAFVIWTLDLRRVVCSPASVWQGHAVWHVLGAAACAGLFLFYRSERVQGRALDRK